MKKKVATIILNRNLKDVTDDLYEKIEKFNNKYTDIYVLDSGSDFDKKSKYTTWSADWKFAKKNGLRFSRGMNYALYNLLKEKKFYNYSYYLFLTNDSEVQSTSFIKKLINIMVKIKKIAILSPCSTKWGEKLILKKEKLKFFWYIHNNAYFIRREFIELILKNKKRLNYKDILFDGNNFRGFGVESELLMKAYQLNYSAAITSEVWIEENENYLLKKSNLIKTDPYNTNMKLYIKEGEKWMKKKYGFSSRWSMNIFVKKFYDKFFLKFPKYKKYKI